MGGEDRVRAAQYVRMSTEHQRYSIEYQTANNLAYAAEHGHEIVRTYADAGISGLTLRRREGLKALLADVLAGRADFRIVLVYDVSRWGRFQDVDQGAHYEYLCREAGVRVEYTAEPFANDASLASTLIKNLKRAMAAEFSRDLSVRISRAQNGMLAQGYWMGGPAPYGLRRVPVSPTGERGAPFEEGQHKGIRGDRTVLAPGPPEEVEVVRCIFHLYAITGLRMAAIAQMLNSEGVLHRPGPDWTRYRIKRVLTNEALSGTLVGGRHSYRLHKCTPRPRADWVRVRNAFEPVVSPDLFDLANRQMRVVHPRVSNEQLLVRLQKVLTREGRLTRQILNAAPDCHCADTYAQRFGGLVRAYVLIGYAPTSKQVKSALRIRRDEPWLRRSFPQPTDDELLAPLRDLLRRTGHLTVDLINTAPDTRQCDVYRRRFGGMRRVYALVGYRPTKQQEQIMDARSGQTVTREEAEALRCRLHGDPRASWREAD